MRDLKQWLQWATTETHIGAKERAERSAALSDPEGDLLGEAAAQIRLRADPDDFELHSQDTVAWCLTHHPIAFRDLCLSFAEAVERMRESVPEALDNTVRCCSHEPGLFCHRCAPDNVDELVGVSEMHMGRRAGMSGMAWFDATSEALQLAAHARMVNEQIAAADAREARRFEVANDVYLTAMVPAGGVPLEQPERCSAVNQHAGRCERDVGHLDNHHAGDWLWCS